MLAFHVLLLVFGFHAAVSNGWLSKTLSEAPHCPSSSPCCSASLSEADEFNLIQIRIDAHRMEHTDACTEDSYEPSLLEKSWVTNRETWTGPEHCDHMDSNTQQAWVDTARATQSKGDGQASQPVEMLATNEHIFSKLCRIGEAPSFIEPLAGILRDPRFDCDPKVSVFSKDWLVFPGAHATGSKMFFDAGGSTFGEALDFFTKSYKAGGNVFDKLFVWEARKQGTENYWAGVSPETRAFWEPRTSFFDGVPVSAEVGHEHNPVSKMYSSCKPEDYCVFKLDIDTPSVELPLVEQLLGNPQETRAKVDELFFEHHVHGVMQKYWGSAVNGTFADSYDLFGGLRRLGVRAHSWV